MLERTAAAAVLAFGVTAAFAAASGALEPAKGSFLVADRDLNDPNFRETVVLLTAYGEDGAMGVIVNWPTAAPADALVPQIEGLGERVDTVFVGGPVSRQAMLMLVRSEQELGLAERIFADVHLSTSRELLRQLAAREIEVAALRLYSGYAGWAPGQLELELAAGGWRVVAGEADLVFAAEPDRVWPELVRRGEARWTRRGGSSPDRGERAPAASERRVARVSPGAAGGRGLQGPARRSQSP